MLGFASVVAYALWSPPQAHARVRWDAPLQVATPTSSSGRYEGISFGDMTSAFGRDGALRAIWSDGKAIRFRRLDRRGAGSSTRTVARYAERPFSAVALPNRRTLLIREAGNRIHLARLSPSGRPSHTRAFRGSFPEGPRKIASTARGEVLGCWTETSGSRSNAVKLAIVSRSGDTQRVLTVASFHEAHEYPTDCMVRTNGDQATVAWTVAVQPKGEVGSTPIFVRRVREHALGPTTPIVPLADAPSGIRGLTDIAITENGSLAVSWSGGQADREGGPGGTRTELRWLTPADETGPTIPLTDFSRTDHPSVSLEPTGPDSVTVVLGERRALSTEQVDVRGIVSARRALFSGPFHGVVSAVAQRRLAIAWSADAPTKRTEIRVAVRESGSWSSQVLVRSAPLPASVYLPDPIMNARGDVAVSYHARDRSRPAEERLRVAFGR